MKQTTQQNTFLIHDYETFGQNPALDLPAQFAGVRTDSNFNIIEEPLILYCRPADDYLPQPEAVIITGITPQFALLNGINEAEFARQINRIFSVPGTCIMGYNNIVFDDEVSRNIFYRNFYDPYAYSWQNGNSRWDLIKVLRACYSLRPEGINWPLNEQGLPSFKLEALSKYNNIQHNNAHNAISDVYATIALARLVKLAQPRLFNYLFQLRSKHKLFKLFDIIDMKPLIHISSMFGVIKNNTSLVVALAKHPTDKNTVIICDLAGDVSLLFKLDVNGLRERLYKRHSELYLDQLSPLPIKLVHLNQCPILVPEYTLRAKDYLRLGLDRQQCMNNLKYLQNHPWVSEKIITVFTHAKPLKITDNVDAQLYNGFFNYSDQKAMQIIRKTLPHNLSNLSLKVKDKRILSLLFRYRARNFQNTLTSHEYNIWQLHRQIILNPEKIKMYTLKLKKLYFFYKKETEKTTKLKELFKYMRQLIN
ncbi:Exodeoxyribonuclease I [Candidatus Profftia lariciata]|uniref:exodeoxyribonuclease I n=1 Tax=Candidatus Profftia lariciata TaxID=1987921 RepID=UPI001D0111CA|nr:exodeoxyribonuclease I [Candidatus Profftia lariciata]UDG81356.1 Exodeoxyribonuclease I [Candidatus Profftia lariciata]